MTWKSLFWLTRSIAWVFLSLAAGWAAEPTHLPTAQPPAPAAPAGNEWVTRIWQTSEGLPQMTVNALVQTRDGYLWIATSGGLARFDGVRFRNFGLADGLPSVQIVSLHEDSQGVLWIGTVGGGISRWEKGRFITLGATEGFQAAVAQVLASETNGTLWIGTDQGLVRGQNGVFKKVGPEDGIPATQVRALLVDSKGVLWVSVLLNGLYQRSGERFAPVPRSSGLSASVYCLIEDREGAVWAGAPNGELWRGQDNTSQRFKATNGVPRNNIDSLAPGTERDIWIGARTSGLHRWADGRASDLTEGAGLSGQTVSALLVDREGTVWVGTAGNGLHRLSRRVLQNWGVAEGLSQGNTSSVVENDSGLWVSTPSKGIWRLQQGRFTKLRDPAVSGEFPFIYALTSTDDGSVWAAGEQCLYRFQTGQKTTAYLTPPIKGEAIRALCVDGGAVWMGTYYSTLIRVDGTNVQVVATNGTFGGNITSLVREDSDTFWIGTSGGLFRWQSGNVKSWTTNAGLLTPSIRALYRDPDGTLWIGTMGGGLSWMKDGTGRILNVTSRQGLADDTISQIVPDDIGNLWLGSNRGLMGLERRELDAFAEGRTASVHPVVLGKNEGMVKEQCTGGHGPTAIKIKDGRLLFPTMGGVVELDPQRLQNVTLSIPHPMIEEVWVDNQRHVFDSPLVMRPGSRQIEIAYTAPSLRGGDWVRFRTRLEGLDRDWVPAGTRRTATYAGLGAGHYVFHVAASDAKGHWSDDVAKVVFVVQPHFWQRAWFGLVVAVMIGGTGVALYRARIARIEARRLAQEAFSRRLISTQEAERARLARELHDDITQRLARLAIDAGRAEPGNAAVDPREMIQGIRTGLVRLSEDVHSLSYKLHPSLLDDLGLAEALKAECDRFARQDSIECEVSLGALPGQFPREIALGLFRVTQEALRNVGRHARARHVKVALRPLDGGLQLAIRDDGVGFDPAVKRNRTSLGLSGMKERVFLLDGELDIESVPDHGTTIVVWVPLKDEPRSSNGRPMDNEPG